MIRMLRPVAAFVLLALPSVVIAGHSNLVVPPSDTFLLGGDQPAAMAVSGKNVGKTMVTVLSRTGAKETEIASVAPGMTFTHSYAVGETALIRNQSKTDTARLSVDFTGSPSSLSMTYALPQK